MKKVLEHALERLEKMEKQITVVKTSYYTVTRLTVVTKIHVTVDGKQGLKERSFIAEGIARRAPIDEFDDQKAEFISHGRAIKALALLMTGREIEGHNWKFSGTVVDGKTEFPNEISKD